MKVITRSTLGSSEENERSGTCEGFCDGSVVEGQRAREEAADSALTE